MTFIENIGITISFVMPPHAYGFGLYPFHWKFVKQFSKVICDDCAAEHVALYLRCGPLLFFVATTH